MSTIEKNTKSTESVYKFIERVGERVAQRLGLSENPANYSGHADKTYQYEEYWEYREVPYLYGALIYVMSFMGKGDNPFENRLQIDEQVAKYWCENKTFRDVVQEEDSGKTTITLYWNDGTTNVLTSDTPGDDPVNIVRASGYGQGAVAAMSHYCKGAEHEYEWDPIRHVWTSVSYYRLTIPVRSSGGTIPHDGVADYSADATKKLDNLGLEWCHEYYMPPEPFYYAIIRIEGYPGFKLAACEDLDWEHSSKLIGQKLTSLAERFKTNRETKQAKLAKQTT